MVNTGVIFTHFQVISTSYTLGLPSPICHLSPGINLDYTSKLLRFDTSSPLHPPSSFTYDMESRELYKNTSALLSSNVTLFFLFYYPPSISPLFFRFAFRFVRLSAFYSFLIVTIDVNYDPDDFVCERMAVPAKDMRPVPLTLIYRKGVWNFYVD